MKSKKELDKSVSSLINSIGDSTQQLKENKGKRFYTDEPINFSLCLDKDKIEWLRNFVLFKRTLDSKFFHYSNTDAIKEGIELLRNKYPEIIERPLEVKYSTSAGRKQGVNNGGDKFYTSYSIRKKDKEFIHDFIYFKKMRGEDFSKNDFFELVFEELEEVSKKQKTLNK